jgi:hypothetical protein
MFLSLIRQTLFLFRFLHIILHFQKSLKQLAGGWQFCVTFDFYLRERGSAKWPLGSHARGSLPHGENCRELPWPASLCPAFKICYLLCVSIGFSMTPLDISTTAIPPRFIRASGIFNKNLVPTQRCHSSLQHAQGMRSCPEQQSHPCLEVARFYSMGGDFALSSRFDHMGSDLKWCPYGVLNL